MTMLATPVAAPVLAVSPASGESSSSTASETEASALDCLLEKQNLFGSTVSLSRLSCSREAIVVMPQQSSPSLLSSFSFDWSDFPVVGDDNHNFEPHEPCHRRNTVTPTVVLSRSPCADIVSQKSVAAAAPSSSDKKTKQKQRRGVRFLSWLDREKSVANAAPSSPDKKTKQKQRRGVHFSSSLEIRRLPVRLGDHPFCVGGMALTVDWANEKDKVEVVDFEAYERQSLKRRIAELRLDFSARRERLIEATGLTVSDLLQQEYEMQFPASQEEEQDALFQGMADSKLSLRKHNRQRQRPTMRHAATVDRSLADLAGTDQA